MFSVFGILNSILLSNKKNDDWIIATWAKIACKIFNVKVRVHNKHKIPQRGCLFLFNHSSFFDIFAFCSVLSDVRFGAKIELFSIPFFGYAMKKAGTLPIARGSREDVFQVYREAIPRLQNHERFALSAEGGRFYGEHLSPFKSGPFIFALSSQAQIAPVIISGAYETLSKSDFLANKNQWQSVINLYFLDPVSVDGKNLEDRQQLQKEVYQKMDEAWISANKK